MRKQKTSELPVKQDEVTTAEVLPEQVEPLADDKLAEYEESATALAYEARDAALRKLKKIAGVATDPYVLGNIIAVTQGVINRPKITNGTTTTNWFSELNEKLKIKTEVKTIEITYSKIPTKHEKEIKPERNSGKPAKRARTSGKHGGGNKRKTR